MKKFLIGLLVALQAGSPTFAATGTYIQGPAMVESVTSTATAAGTTTLTKASQTVQNFTGTSTQTVVLPDATTLPVGRKFEFYNASTGGVTINANGGTFKSYLAQNGFARFRLTANGTAAGTWAIEDNTASVASGYTYGIMTQAGGGASCERTVSTTGETNWLSLGNGSGCQTPSFVGVGSNSSPNTLQYVMGAHPAGTYTFTLATFFIQGTNGTVCNFRFTDGTNSWGYQVVYSSTASNGGGPLVGTITLPAASSRTISVQAAGSNSASCGTSNSNAGRTTEWTVHYDGPIAGTQITKASDMADVLGTVFSTAATTCPANSIAADGGPISRTTYVELYNRIGTTYGVGDGSTTFGIPDMRGVFMRGAGTQSVGGINRTGTQGTTEIDQFQGHYHSPSAGNGGFLQVGTNGSAPNSTYSSGSFGSYGVTGNPATGTDGTVRSGGETRPANISAKFCIWAVRAPASLFAPPSGMELIESKTASSSATIDFTNLSTSVYKSYVLKIENAIPATNATSLLMRFSNAGSFVASGYSWQNWRITDAGSGVSGENGTGTAIALNSTADTMANTASIGGTWTIQIPSLNNTNAKQVTYNGYYLGSQAIMVSGGGRSGNTTAVDGIRLIQSSGNIASGTFTLYGIR